MIAGIIATIIGLDLLWVFWAWRRTRTLRRRAVWRWVLLAFFFGMVSNFVWLMLFRASIVSVPAPAISLAIAYIWHLLVLPVTGFFVIPVEQVTIGVLKFKDRKRSATIERCGSTSVEHESLVSRRQFLKAAAVAGPPAIAVVSGIGGYFQAQGFRIRRVEIDLPTLPPELDGVTIAQVNDIHTGRFTDEKVLAKIIEATNALRADIIVSPGDLIDFSLSDLPYAIDAVSKLDAPGGVFLCEGNHDLFQSRSAFESGLKKKGLGLLINESAGVRLRGRDIQIHGLRWGTKETPHDRSHDAGARQNMELLKNKVDPDAFSILLAHHPHAFDAAMEHHVPLTLAGHTHGGQLMLTHHIGAGPLLYKYWSGLYRQDVSRLMVSNGVGNWLPLRVNAPAEIVHITLRAMAVA